MRKSKAFTKGRLAAALAGGIVSGGLYKLYVYATNRAQFEDSNLLVSVLFVLIAAGFIFLVLELAAMRGSSK